MKFVVHLNATHNIKFKIEDQVENASILLQGNPSKLDSKFGSEPNFTFE